MGQAVPSQPPHFGPLEDILLMFASNETLKRISVLPIALDEKASDPVPVRCHALHGPAPNAVGPRYIKKYFTILINLHVHWN